MRVVVVAALLLAGCADGPDAVPDPAPVPEEPEPIHNVTVVEPVEVNETIGGFTIQAAGGADSWLVAYQPLPEPSDSMGFSASYRFTTDQGDAWGFFIRPTLTHVAPGGWEMGRLDPFSESLIQHSPDGIDMQRSYSQGSSTGGQFHGLFLAATADIAWTLEVEVVWDDALPVATPEHVLTGEGSVFGHGAARPLPDGPAGQMRYDATVAGAGWTHLEMLKHAVQPTGVRDVAMGLPNGHGYDGIQTSTGYDVVVMGSASGNRVDYIGSMNGTAGDLYGEVTYAEADLSLDFAHLHLPGEAMPPGLVGGDYMGSTWPFQDLRLPDDP